MPAQRQVVFVSDRSGAGDIYLARLDGSGLRRITDHAVPERLPRCSPDRRRIAFIRGEGAAAELMTLDLATGAERSLTSDEVRDSTPEWSRDGRLIYFTRRDDEHDRLAVIGANGGAASFLTPAGVHNVMPAISPDGRSLVHHSYAFGRETELQLLDLQSSSLTRLTNAAGSDYEATFAGAGRLVFSSNRAGGHYRLYEQRIGEAEARMIADTGADSWTARWSRGELLFSTGTRDNWRMMRIARAGAPPEPLLDDGHSNSTPDWC